ncbi:recombinase family protein [Chryseobacterium sp. HSC-36S06]|uniref:recombinase family protein n=1 Tax=Chryseobacterium sp. HSC-36S06 TaxID=2910970 RepID=UPI0020A09ED0|nr:recombinase family protein [Chryseobacterium sp. HSC-36S06]MCP2037320.1 DNA invertase Pin-like site-specific DNA recombinase [Chryseobacterium sp. HSC-36S06]
MKIKYNRTSTISQQGLRFEADKDEYDLILFDQISGTTPFTERLAGKKLLDLVSSGVVKTVVFEEISRIARNTMETLRVLEILESHGVNVIIRNMGLQSRPVDGKLNPIYGICVSLIGSLAQLELEQHKIRIAQGREVARMKGIVKFGRPVGTNESEKTFLMKEKSKNILKYLNKKRSIREISKILGVSTKTVMKVKTLVEKHKKIAEMRVGLQ